MDVTEIVTPAELPNPVRQAIGRAILKVTLPLWIGAVLGCGIGLGAGVWFLRELDDQQLAGCRDRNSAQELDRQKWHRFYAGLRLELPTALDVIDRLEADLPSPSQEDVDCDQDGQLGDGDYGGARPEHLPLEPVKEPT